jgi:cell division protein FtsZ
MTTPPGDIPRPVSAPPPSPLTKPALTLAVLGVGGAGGNAIAHLSREPLEGVSFTALNTDAAALARLPLEGKRLLGAQTTRGLGAGGDPERGRVAAEEDAAQLRALCEGAQMVFLVAGLGGGTGTGASPVLARLAKDAGALVLATAILPFDCEGTRRQRQALLGLRELKSVADVVITLPNQKVLKLVDEKTSLCEAFEFTHELVAQGLRGLWRLLSRPGLINVDFADLCAVTQDKHAESTLAYAEARGDNRAREALDKLWAHPLLEGGHTLAEASEMLVSITGGPELALTDVNRIMEQITRQAEQAHVIMGAHSEPEFADRLCLTLVAARRGEGVSVPLRFAEASGSRVTDPTSPEGPELDTRAASRAVSRFIAPPPDLTPEQAQKLLAEQGSGATRSRRSLNRWRQGQLPLEIISKGRFEKSEPTLHQGEDLDVPTYIRRGVALN